MGGTVCTHGNRHEVGGTVLMGTGMRWGVLYSWEQA